MCHGGGLRTKFRLACLLQSDNPALSMRLAYDLRFDSPVESLVQVGGNLILFVIGELTMSIGSLTIFLIAVGVVGAFWGSSRVRARRRWKSAIDSFAELQMIHEPAARFLYESQASLAEPVFRSRERQTITG
jgi:hypothetical protein